MPIDYKKYPKNWLTEIRPAILKRARNRCEKCRVPHYCVVKWDKQEKQWERCCGSAYLDDIGWQGARSYQEARQLADHWNECCDEKRWIVIVLTIAHLDNDVNHNDYDNLAALCQRCHLKYDIAYRKANRKLNQGQLAISLQ